MMKLSVKEMTCVAISVALITICSWISVPLTIPVTLQTFAICLVTALLGLKLGLWALLSYILLGAVGIPVFSGFRGGFGALLGVTGGYIVGFIFTVLTVGLAVKRFGRPMPVLILSMAAGILLCYAFGTAWFMVVYARGGNAVTLGGALSMCVLPYLIPDGIKIVLAAALVKRLWPVASKELIPA
jgi:biotin transport system substrate-specific component